MSDYSDTWLWLFPLTYAAHIAEEYWGRLLEAYPMQISPTQFLTWQSLGLTLMIVGVVLSQRLRFRYQLLTILATIALGNSLVHLARTILFKTYDAGLITGLLIWFPLGLITLVRVRSRVPRTKYLLHIGIGIAICAAVELISHLNTV